MKKFLLASALSLGLASAACAQLLPRADNNPANATGGPYKLDKAHVSVIFGVSHLGYSHYLGRFDTIDATLTYNAGKPELSAVTATIDPASVNTGNLQLQEKLKGADFFDVSHYRSITFTSTSITKTGAKTGDITGDLTLHGITKEITLHATFNGAGMHPFTGKPVIGFSATGSFKRSDFGVSSLLPAVGDEVTLNIEAEFDQ